jgi:hypothetical protein
MSDHRIVPAKRSASDMESSVSITPESVLNKEITLEEYMNFIRERVDRDIEEYENRNEIHDNFNCGLIGDGGSWCGVNYDRSEELYQEYIKNKNKYTKLFNNSIISSKEYHKKHGEIYKEYARFFSVLSIKNNLDNKL